MLWKIDFISKQIDTGFLIIAGISSLQVLNKFYCPAIQIIIVAITDEDLPAGRQVAYSKFRIREAMNQIYGVIDVIPACGRQVHNRGREMARVLIYNFLGIQERSTMLIMRASSLAR